MTTLETSAALRAAEVLKTSLAAALQADPDLLLDMIEGETDLLETVDALLLAELADAAGIEALDGAIGVLKGRQQRLEARQATRRALLEQALMLLERKKLERPTATISLTERAPAVRVDDESAIPARFFVNKPTLDKKALNEAVKAGEDVPGVSMSNGSVSLTVRRK
jgi:hypothetical protein